MRHTFRMCAGILLLAIWSTAAQAGPYEDLLTSLATPLFPTFKDALDGYSNAQVLIRTEQARQRLMKMGVQPNDIDAIRSSALTKLDSCHWSMEEIRRLDRNIPDIAGIAEKGILATPALLGRKDPTTGEISDADKQAELNLAAKGLEEVIKAGWNAYQSSSYWQDYRDKYADARKIGLQLAEVAARRSTASRPSLYGIGIKFSTDDAGITKVTGLLPDGPASKAGLQVGDILASSADAAKVYKPTLSSFPFDDGVPKPGEQGSEVLVRVRRGDKTFAFDLKRSMRLPVEKQLIGLRFTGSWDGTFARDQLALKNNSGRDLTNCVAVVTLEKDSPTPGTSYVRKHLHFVERWPAGEEKWALYNGRNADGIARNESLDRVQRVFVDLYSDQVCNTVEYEYWNSQEYAGDVRRWCEDMLSFSGEFAPATTGFFASSDASVSISLKDAGDKVVKVSKFTPSKITITVRQGSDSQSLWWTGSEWESGFFNRSRTFGDARFNRFSSPDSFEMRLAFPGTKYEHVVSWDVK